MSGPDRGPVATGAAAAITLAAVFADPAAPAPAPDGSLPPSHEVLADLAAEAGEDRGEAHEFLASGLGLDEVAQAEARASSLGITGVPFFIVDGRYGLSGAQPAEAFVEATPSRHRLVRC